MATMYEIKDHVINLDQVVWIDKVGRRSDGYWYLDFHLVGQNIPMCQRFEKYDDYVRAIAKLMGPWELI